jgi:hypothetical protein
MILSGFLFAFAMLLLVSDVFAELQNVEVGGSIRIRGNYIGNTFNSFAGPSPGPETRWSALSVMRRPTGNLLGPVSVVFLTGIVQVEICPSWNRGQGYISRQTLPTR